jgi:N-acetylneuraminic acid mutarotase
MQFKHKLSYIALGSVFVMVVLLGMASITSAQSGPWSTKAPMPTARNLLSTCVVDGKLYTIGGSLSPTTSTLIVEVYDPATNSWTKKADLPQAICGLAACAVNDKIYVFGGATSVFGAVSSSVYIYDPVSDAWTKKVDMPTARAYLSASVVNGKIYVIGGAPSVFSPAYKTVEEYDPATDTWIRKADMPTARCTHSAGVMDGKIYAIGGMVGGPTPWKGLSVVEAYDPATDTWTRKADMPTRRLCHSVSAVDGKIYSMGGGTSNSDAVVTLEEYDPITDTWTRKADMPTARWGLSASVVDGKIYAVGGALVSNMAVSTVEEYDPASEPTNVEEGYEATAVPTGYALSQNYPNPFNPTTSIDFDLSKTSKVTLKIFNILGEEVATLVSDMLTAGSYSYEWSRPAGIASGVYLFRMEAGEFVETKKMILMR